MKRMLLLSSFFLCALFSKAQLEETFTTLPTGWTLSQGASFGAIAGNALILTPGAGANNPAVIGTPAVSKTSNTVEVCLDIWAYTPNLNNQVPFACDTYMDVLFVKSSVTSVNDALDPLNIISRVDNHLLPTNGGNTCFTFTFPAEVTDPSFKVFLSFHGACNQGGQKFVVDNVKISGVDNICTSACAPTALDDLFPRTLPNEMSFQAVLYGSNINFPAPPSGFVVDLTGTDNDPFDSYSHLQWSLVEPPTNGNVILNADGTATITRNSINVSQLTFKYRLCNDGVDDNPGSAGDNLCDEATVTVTFPVLAPTPVTLINYTAGRYGSDVMLKWSTTVETNNTGFEVQRSIGSEPFKTIAFIKSKGLDGNSNVTLKYEYKDDNPTNKTSLYRLVQVDHDGRARAHGIKTVRGTSEEAKMQLFPNPTYNGQVVLVFSNSNQRDISISDMQGKVVKNYINAKSDKLSITDLEPGMYVLQVLDKDTNERTIEKVVVLKK